VCIFVRTGHVCTILLVNNDSGSFYRYRLSSSRYSFHVGTTSPCKDHHEGRTFERRALEGRNAVFDGLVQTDSAILVSITLHDALSDQVANQVKVLMVASW
jgi:hypothetical protein